MSQQPPPQQPQLVPYPQTAATAVAAQQQQQLQMQQQLYLQQQQMQQQHQQHQQQQMQQQQQNRPTGNEPKMVKRDIIYGSIATPIGKEKPPKALPNASHEWTLFIRCPANKPLSFIKYVIFQLHSSFEQPLRKVTQPPFQCTEYGWGEFDVKIDIFFQDDTIPPVTLNHYLRLFPELNSTTTREKATAPAGSAKKPVISEHWDELIFINPRPSFAQHLQPTSRHHDPQQLEQDNAITKYTDPFLVRFATTQFQQYHLLKVKQLEEAKRLTRDQINNVLAQLWLLESEVRIAQAVDGFLKQQYPNHPHNVIEEPPPIAQIQQLAIQQFEQQQQQQHQQQHNNTMGDGQ